MRRLDSVIQRHHDKKVICYRRCSERQGRAQPWVCQRLVTHLRREPFRYQRLTTALAL